MCNNNSSLGKDEIDIYLKSGNDSNNNSKELNKKKKNSEKYNIET